MQLINLTCMKRLLSMLLLVKKGYTKASA